MGETLHINGQDKSFNVLPQSLAQLLSMLKIDEATVVAEINGNIIQRSDFAKTALKGGEKIELIRFVGGG